jgi:hypothetical protein
MIRTNSSISTSLIAHGQSIDAVDAAPTFVEGRTSCFPAGTAGAARRGMSRSVSSPDRTRLSAVVTAVTARGSGVSESPATLERQGGGANPWCCRVPSDASGARRTRRIIWHQRMNLSIIRCRSLGGCVWVAEVCNLAAGPLEGRLEGRGGRAALDRHVPHCFPGTSAVAISVHDGAGIALGRFSCPYPLYSAPGFVKASDVYTSPCSRWAAERQTASVHRDGFFAFSAKLTARRL